VIEAAEQIETLVPEGEGIKEVVADKGYHSNQELVGLEAVGVGERLYFLRAAESAEDRALWSISIDGTQETRLTEVRSYNPIDAYDVSATGDVVWVQQRRGRSEVWLADFRRP
jgi:hypothetical protein